MPEECQAEAAQASVPTPRRIRTDDWPEQDRIALFHAMFGGDRVRVAPLPDEPLRIHATLLKLPRLGLVWGRRSPLRSDFSDGSDRLVFSLGGPAVATQFGREHVLEAGDAIALSGADRGSLTTLREGRIATLEFPNGGLLPLLAEPACCCGRRVPKGTPALLLLRTYLKTLLAGGSLGPPRLRQLAIDHIHDLAALALGASDDAAETASARGLRAARLRAIKADLLANLDRDLRLDEVAARQQVSTRYVRMLFESEGTSFTRFLRDARLKRARSMLLDPRFDGRRIGQIAYDVGFNDLSYFNRSFRHRFGHAPGETRESRPTAPS